MKGGTAVVFSSAAFLFVFLPIVFCLSRALRGIRAQNALLALCSLAFYGFGEPGYVLLLLASVLINYVAGLLVARPTHKRAAVAGAVILNLGLLCVFKYTDFAISTLNLLPGMSLAPVGILLPAGISFFTFQGLSYVVDVYRDPSQASKSLVKLALYVAFFPQLIAGPIVKYHDVSLQIDNRQATPALTADGMRRFILGLSKKLLLSNTVGQSADLAFTATAQQLDARSAWLGALCYMMQIYFDFSGYSDMAIGLGRMFGPAGSGTTCTSPWAATARGAGARPSIRPSCFSVPGFGMVPPGTLCYGACGTGLPSCWRMPSPPSCPAGRCGGGRPRCSLCC